MMSLLRVFKVVDADEFTRDYHQRTLGVALAPAQVRRSVGGAPSHGLLPATMLLPLLWPVRRRPGADLLLAPHWCGVMVMMAGVPGRRLRDPPQLPHPPPPAASAGQAPALHPEGPDRAPILLRLRGREEGGRTVRERATLAHACIRAACPP